MTAKKIFPASRRQKDARIAQIFILNSATHLKIHTYSQCGRQKVHLYTHGRHFWTYVNKDERGFYALTASQFCCFVMQVQTGTRTFVPVLPLCSLQSVKAKVEEESCPPRWTPTLSASSPSLHSCLDTRRRGCGKWSAWLVSPQESCLSPSSCARRPGRRTDPW